MNKMRCLEILYGTLWLNINDPIKQLNYLFVVEDFMNKTLYYEHYELLRFVALQLLVCYFTQFFIHYQIFYVFIPIYKIC